MDWPVQLAGLGASLAINAYRTLKLLELGITIVGDNYDPLCGLSRELRFIAGINILEELQLEVMVPNNFSYLNGSEDCSVFDSVLTESGAFPMLHRVSVEIWWFSKKQGTERARRFGEKFKGRQFPSARGKQSGGV